MLLDEEKKNLLLKIPSSPIAIREKKCSSCKQANPFGYYKSMSRSKMQNRGRDSLTHYLNSPFKWVGHHRKENQVLTTMIPPRTITGHCLVATR